MFTIFRKHHYLQISNNFKIGKCDTKEIQKWEYPCISSDNGGKWSGNTTWKLLRKGITNQSFGIGSFLDSWWKLSWSRNSLLIWNLKTHHMFTKEQFDLILSYLNPLHTSYSYKINFNIFIPSPSLLWPEFFMYFLFPFMCDTYFFHSPKILLLNAEESRCVTRAASWV